MIYLFEQMRRQLRRAISRSEWAIRFLRLTTSAEPNTEPGLLLIQIDGLSHRQLERALAQGRLPFVRAMVHHQNYELTPFYSGLPSTTPAVQGELFYGVCCAVPAFSFLDRGTKRLASMYVPDWVKLIEADLASRGERGLLKAGSSWSNIYSGGAELAETHFCAASIGPGDLFKSASLLGFLGILVFHFSAVLRLIWLLLLEVLWATADAITGSLSGERVGKEFKFIISRVFVCIGLREAVALGAAIDLARGLPIVHVNLLGYDEQSHRRGPNSRFAHASLKGIDQCIRHLYLAAHRSHRRDYQVWLFADHGHENAHSFEAEHPGGLEQVVHEGLERIRRTGQTRGRRTQPTESPLYWAGGPHVRRRLAARARAEALTPEEEQSFTVAAAGPVGHLYLAQPLDPEQGHEFARWLVHQGQVPGVVYRVEPGRVRWIHSKGETLLPDEADQFLPHLGSLKREVAEDLVRLTEHRFAGDFVLLGWHPDRDPWTFPIEHGAHGGPGLEETSGFVLWPAGTRVPDAVRQYLRPGTLRKAILHHLRRQRLPSRKRVIDDTGTRRLRVMTYNVHGCLGMDGRISPARIARVIERYEPDLVALQEIDLGRVRSRGHDQAKLIAEELEMEVCFCPTVVRGTEQYGHALLSRFPMKVICTGLLSGGPTATGREPRGALLVRAELDNGYLYLLNTHFGLGRFERAAQVTDLLGARWLGGLNSNEPLVVCGDFNMLPGSFPYRALASRVHDVQLRLRHFRPLNTFAALFPFSRIDHIFISTHFEVEQVRVPQNDLTRVASDHLPLIADLRVNLDLVQASGAPASVPAPVTSRT